MVGAGPNGADHLVRFGGREDELDVLGWLFNDLQQGVEARRCDHVGLINNENLVPVANGGEGGALPEIPGIVDAAVAGGVNFNHVKAAGPTARKLNTAVADTTRDGGGALGAVQAAREDSGGSCLSATARTGKQVGVVDPALLDGSHEGLSDVLLADDIRKSFGAVSAVKGCAHKRTLSVGGDVLQWGFRTAPRARQSRLRGVLPRAEKPPALLPAYPQGALPSEGSGPSPGRCPSPFRQAIPG